MNLDHLRATAAAVALTLCLAPAADADSRKKGGKKKDRESVESSEDDSSRPGKGAKRCKTKDLRGTWMSYISTTSAPEAELEGWARCRLVVRRNGRINASRSKCFDNADNPIDVQRGRFKISRQCTVKGNVLDSNGIKYNLKHAQMNRHRNTIMGVGRSDAGQVGTFMAVLR